MCMHIMYVMHVICDLSGSTTFFHIIPSTEQFLEERVRERERKEVTANKMCVLIFFTTLKHLILRTE